MEAPSTNRNREMLNRLTDPKDVAQLQKALLHAHKVAWSLMQCAVEQTAPTRDVLDDFSVVRENASDAVLAMKD